MAKSKSQAKREEAQKAPEGCEACNNTGLVPGRPTTEAEICPVCKGSPFEKHPVNL